MSADPYASTEHAHESHGGNGRRPDGDCDAGTRALHLLVGDPRNPESLSVFAQLRGLQSLVHELRTSARLVVLFAGVIAVCSAWSVWQR